MSQEYLNLVSIKTNRNCNIYNNYIFLISPLAVCNESFSIGSKHIDPDSGLIYFKYDFGYEFGIVLPGEARKIARSRSVPPGDKSGDIEIPVIHERSDDESKSSKKVKFSSSKGDKGKVLQYSVPKKQSQFQCLPKEPFSDSEAETRIRAHLPHAKPKFVAPYVKPFAPPLPKSSLKRTQPFQKTDRGNIASE